MTYQKFIGALMASGYSKQGAQEIFNDMYVTEPLPPPPPDEDKPMAFGISSYDSNAMKSCNPHSGIYVAESSRTLDLNGGKPDCNQGGIAIVVRRKE